MKLWALQLVGASLKDGWFEAIIFRKTRPYIK